MRMICNSRFCFYQYLKSAGCYGTIFHAYLETLILKNTLDSCVLSVWSQLGLEDHSKGAISHDLALSVLHFFGLASHAILYFLTDNLYVL